MAGITVKGTTFTTDAVTGDVFFRTDTDMNQWYTYDGTRWFSDQVYESRWTAASLTGNGTTGFTGRIENNPIFVEGIDIASTVVTTNDSDNYWTITIHSYGPAYTADSNTAISASVLTDSDAADTWINHDADATVASAVPDDYGVFAGTVAKTGSPGTLRLFANVRYRKIQT